MGKKWEVLHLMVQLLGLRCRDNIDDAGNIISKIASEGEKQSKSIRNAFKKASIPSKGLIDEIGIEI